MKWLKKLFKTKTEETPIGISLGGKAKWLISGVNDPIGLLEHLKIIFTEPNYIMFFEGTSIADDVKKYLEDNSISNPIVIAPGTIWPKPDTYQIILTEESINEIIKLEKVHASCEISDHFHIYKDNKIYLEWHDAWGKDPILCSAEVAEDKLRIFCEKTDSKYEYYYTGA